MLIFITRYNIKVPLHVIYYTQKALIHFVHANLLTFFVK